MGRDYKKTVFTSVREGTPLIHELMDPLSIELSGSLEPLHQRELKVFPLSESRKLFIQTNFI
jgi:hypothetical protein